MRVVLKCGDIEVKTQYPRTMKVTVAQALTSMKRHNAHIYDSWCDNQGRIQNSLLVFVNNENIRYLNGLNTILNDGDDIFIIPFIAGG